MRILNETKMNHKSSTGSITRKPDSVASQNSSQPVFRRSGTYVIDKKEASSLVQIDAEYSPNQRQPNPPMNSGKKPVVASSHSKLSKMQSLPVKPLQPSSANSANSQKSDNIDESFATSKVAKNPIGATRSSNNNLALIKEKKRAELKTDHVKHEPHTSSTTHHHKSIELVLRNARKSGHLNLSDFGLTDVPSQIWHLNAQDMSTSSKTAASIDTDEHDFKWWDQVDLNKLILASNKIQIIPKDVQHLSTLVTFDVIF